MWLLEAVGAFILGGVIWIAIGLFFEWMRGL